MENVFLVVLVICFVAPPTVFCDMETYRRNLLLQGLLQAAFNLTTTAPRTANLAFKAVLKYQCVDIGEAAYDQELPSPLAELNCCVEGVITNTTRPTTLDPRESILYACRVAEDVGNCSLTHIKDMKPCLSAQRRYNVQQARNNTRSLLTYVCGDNGDRVLEFISGGGPECVKSTEEALKKCVEDYGDDEVTDSTVTSGELEESECKHRDDIIKCIRTQLQTCTSTAAVKFFDGLVEAADQYSPCTALKETVIVDAVPAKPGL